MARIVLLLGKSGAGKSASLRNVSEKVMLINVIKKPLPFKNNPNIGIINCDEYLNIRQYLEAAYKEKGVKVAVIDDAGYLLTNKFMAGHKQAKGNSQFDLYNELADNFYSLIRFAADELPEDMIVFFVMHEDKNDFGETKPKTIGKLLDDKVCVEGMFTIVLHAMKLDGKYIFKTKTDGLDVTKTPIGMFENEDIDNDLQDVVNKIRDYYKS